ncbi:HIT family protein [Denitratisoma oestradiolicum]|uniref:Protein hit n=1 Tax=Denitratisoma oestradiolicum TaxID=311182 RepID=A0A6S6YNR6_9PROT|nr:HIT family protein [Denitratisoma oestradiolicum]TWO80301.1 HIT family protein [Denitratisoma oestradiolicum]CAB1369398.1 Protein hit [Denitratisoma oestradiolicum]
MAYDPQNIFARILRGEIPCIPVHEDAHTLAFMDIMPQADGHTLVIPREPAETIFDLSPEAAHALIASTQKVARAVRAALEAPGILLAQVNGAAAGQTVPHVHFHIIPRRGGEPLGLHAAKMEDAEKLKSFAARIIACLDSN